MRELRPSDTGAEEGLDAITRMASSQLGAPIVAMLLCDADERWVKSSVGLDPADPAVAEALAACADAARAGVVHVTDARTDPRIAEAFAALRGPLPMRACLAVALRIDQQFIGALCAFDTVERPFDERQRLALDDLARIAAALIASTLGERRMRLQTARVRTASLSSSDWLWETNAAGRVTWVSDSIEAHTGRPPSSDIGLTMRDINRRSDADTHNTWDRFVAHRLKREPFKDLITERLTPKGVVVTSISGVPVFDRQGEFRGYRGATSNITVRLQAERAAREAEQLLSDALETLVASVMITDASGRVIRSNAEWRRHIGKPPDDAEQNWPDLVRKMTLAGEYPDAIGNEEAFIRWRLAMPDDGGRQHELRWRSRWIIVSARRLPGGNVVHMSIDITGRKKAELALTAREAELRESQQRLSAVLQAVPDLWFVLDREGRFLECSSPDHPMLVHDWPAIRGRKFGVGVSAQLASAAMAAVRAAVETGTVQRHEYPLKTHDGVTRWFEARVSPMPGEQVLYVTRDLTDLRALERDLMLMKRAVEAAAALPMCVTDANQPDMPMVYANPAFETLTGYTHAEWLGRNCRLLQGHMTDQPGLVELREALAARRECTVVLENFRKDGTPFTNSLHVAPVFDGNGELTHCIGVLQDVTAQSRAADKLRLSEQLYRSVASAISDGLVVVTPTLTVIAINPAGSKVLGTDPERLTGSTDPWPFEFLSAQGRPLATADHPVLRVVRTGEPLVGQVHVLRRGDGQRRWIELNAHPLQLRPDGNTFSVVLTFRDITQQRDAEQALVVAEERWNFALEGSGDGVWDWDVRTDTVFYSPRWKTMMGFAEDDIGNSLEEWTSRIHADDLSIVALELQRHLRGETPVYQSEHRVRHRDGRDLWILGRGKVVSHDAAGHPLRVVGTHSDITRAKLAEQALRDKQAAELASQAKSQFLSRMSHEMRTPLNAVIGFAQLMQLTPGGADKADVGQYAEHILHAGQHLLALINDVLDLQKVEEGGLPLTLGPVSLSDIVFGALELLQPAAAARGVRLLNEVPPATWVRADVQRLRQVVLNIASNAIKYNLAGGHVRLAVADPHAARPTLLIEDSGPGMTDAQMGRLFQPFERLGRETSSIEGTGLGLIIARSLTQAIGGRLEVGSQPGRGTRVAIELQRDDPPAPTHDFRPPKTEDNPTVNPTLLPLRMLYVEDNRINAILFEGALRMHNSHVELRVAEDGDEALTVARDWLPDVLVLDAHLPGMSGFDVLKALRQMPGLAHAPAYMCSADAMPEDVQRAYEAGFIGYWTKPIDITAVLADIDALAQRLRGAASAA